jgi:hypothetical protein
MTIIKHGSGEILPDEEPTPEPEPEPETDEED